FDGSVTSTVSGGVQPYAYLWDNGSTTADQQNLVAGGYCLIVNDANGCIVSSCESLTAPYALNLVLSSTNVSCAGDANGTVSSVVNGGTLAYTYNWSNGETTAGLIEVQAGNYSLTVQDANACTIEESVEVTQPQSLNIVEISSNPLCAGDQNGSVALSVSGGTSPYLYSWSNGAGTNMIDGLVSGQYCVTVTDYNNCQEMLYVTLNDPLPLDLTLYGSNLSCFESNNGSITADITGGTGTYSFSWSNSETSQIIDQLAAGSYSLIVNDVNACSVSGEYTLTQPQTLFVDLGPDFMIDAGDTATISATPGYASYLWNTGESTMSIEVTEEDDYVVTVTNSQGCTGTDSMYLSVNPYIIQEIPLPVAWSLFSINVYPNILPIHLLMANIASNVAIVKNSDGAIWWPLFNLNQIGDVVVGEGYQVNMWATDTLYAEGMAVVPENHTLNLLAGWSIIAYLRQEPANLVEMMSPIVNSIAQVKNSDGQIYWPLFGLNQIGNMNPSEGYQINLYSAALLTYPANSANTSKVMVVNEKPRKYVHDINTGNNMTLGLPQSAWTNIPEIGDEIGVFNKLGELAGSGVYNGNNLAIAIWGDDLITEEQELFTKGESFEIRLWNKNDDSEEILEIVSWAEGINEYSENGIAVVEKMASFIHNETRDILLPNYPNPFSNETVIEFVLVEKSNVQIELFNVLGKNVALICNTAFLKGEHRQTINGQNLPAGNYIVRMKTNNKYLMQKISILH
ncbi:MAG: T9SS type A sorting domain-containing protein, partial [Bacteroidota bacterium]|nr:T9SS type A sorting domain-containing protein [Bacteroidota bacterium]